MDKTENRLSSVIDNVKHPLESEIYRLKCKEILDKEGVLVLKELLQPNIIQKILKEAESQEHLAYFCINNHNAYLSNYIISFYSYYLKQLWIKLKVTCQILLIM